LRWVCRIIIGPFRVRASATSRLAPPAGFHAARADSNAPKTDEASPFALLVGATVPPAQKPSGTPGGKSDDKPDDNKTTADQAGAAQTTQATQAQHTAPAHTARQAPANDSGQDADDQTAADQDTPAPDSQQAGLNMTPLSPVAGDDQAASDPDDDLTSDEDGVSLWPQSARPQPPTGQTAKPVKADKGDKKEAKDQPTQPDAAAAATDLLPPDLQVAAATPPAVPPATVPTVTDDGGQTEIAAAPAIAPAAQPVAPATADPIPPQAASQDAPQDPNAAAPQPPVAGAQPAPKTISPAPAALANAATGDTRQPGADQPQVGLPNDATTTTAAKSQPKPVAAKTDGAGKAPKPASGKAQQGNDPAAVKGADTVTPGDDGDDNAKADAVKSAAPANDAAAPKPAANTANAAITIPAASPPVLPQAQAPTFTQHVQVTAQSHDTSPNLPALAVDIVAKSQSGAKQFDIRLDPPELGRVEVRLSIDATGKASAHLSADQPQTLNLLQKDASVLTRALRDAGLDVSQNGLNFSLRQQSGQDSGAGTNPGRRTGRGLSLTATTSIEATAASAAYSARADGRLDIKV
jgi:flagellar hook-length control protein FliK